MHLDTIRFPGEPGEDFVRDMDLMDLTRAYEKSRSRSRDHAQRDAIVDCRDGVVLASTLHKEPFELRVNAKSSLRSQWSIETREGLAKEQESGEASERMRIRRQPTSGTTSLNKNGECQ